MKTTVVLSDAIVCEAKRRAAELGITFNELTERALREALAEPRAAAAERIVLPTAGHGLPLREHTVAELNALEHDDDLT